MQNIFIVSAMQHSCRAKPLFPWGYVQIPPRALGVLKTPETLRLKNEESNPKTLNLANPGPKNQLQA